MPCETDLDHSGPSEVWSDPMPEGPRLPRKATFSRRIRESLEGVAYQIGVLLAVQRNRLDWTQWDLAAELGIEQIDISRIENGEPTGVSDQKIDQLFTQLELEADSCHANFIKWWRKNSTL